MKARLNQLLDVEHLSPSKFADHIGVQRSSVSHVLSGRNNPSFDFLAKTLKAFPDLNADWLILGKGAMFDRSERSEGSLFQAETQTDLEQEQPVPGDVELFPEIKNKPEPHVAPARTIQKEATAHQPKTKGDKLPKVTRVVLFYEDNTFHSYEPED